MPAVTRSRAARAARIRAAHDARIRAARAAHDARIRAARAARVQAARQVPNDQSNTDLRDLLLRKLGETGHHLSTPKLLELCEKEPGVRIRINTDDIPDPQDSFVDNVTLGVAAHSTDSTDDNSHVILAITMGFNQYAADDKPFYIQAIGEFNKETFQPVQLLSSHVGHGDHRSSYEVDPKEDYEKEKARVLQSAVEDFMMHFSHEMTQAEVKKDAQCLPQ